MQSVEAERTVVASAGKLAKSPVVEAKNLEPLPLPELSVPHASVPPTIFKTCPLLPFASVETVPDALCSTPVLVPNPKEPETYRFVEVAFVVVAFVAVKVPSVAAPESEREEPLIEAPEMLP